MLVEGFGSLAWRKFGQALEAGSSGHPTGKAESDKHTQMQTHTHIHTLSVSFVLFVSVFLSL